VVRVMDSEMSQVKLIHLDVDAELLPISAVIDQQATIKDNRHCSSPATLGFSLYPVNVEIISHRSSVSPSWLGGVKQITYSSHTCVQAHIHFC